MYCIRTDPRTVKLIEPESFRKVEDMVRDAGARGGINFGYFSPGRPHPKRSYPVGACVLAGRIVRPESPPHFWTLLSRSGKLTVEKVYRFTPEWAGDIDWAIGGGPRLLAGGRAIPRAEQEPPWRPYFGRRTAQVAVGLVNGGTVLLCGWKKATLEECQRDLLSAGVREALKGDSGSSATFVWRGRRLIGWGQYVPNAFVAVDGVLVRR